MSKTLSLSDAKARLSEVVRGVRRTGLPVVVTVDGEAVVEIAPIAAAPRDLSATEAATAAALYAGLFRIPRPETPFDAVALVGDGRR